MKPRLHAVALTRWDYSPATCPLAYCVHHATLLLQLVVFGLKFCGSQVITDYRRLRVPGVKLQQFCISQGDGVIFTVPPAPPDLTPSQGEVEPGSLPWCQAHLCAHLCRQGGGYLSVAACVQGQVRTGPVPSAGLCGCHVLRKHRLLGEVM